MLLTLGTAGGGATPMLAAGLDWLEGLLPLLFVFIWIVSQVAAVVKKLGEKKPAAAPVRPPVRPAGGPPLAKPPRRGEPAGGGLDVALREQIEQFLRDRPPESIRIERADPPAVPPQQPPRRQPPQRRPQKPTPAVAKGRQRAVGESSVAEMPHLVSSLKPAVSDEPRRLPPAASVAVAGTIAGLLADPRSLRQAIVLREVLDRPVERWT